MARPRTFDETTALMSAARTFRRHGYADTTTEQLCGAVGVGRGSLYNAFTSKDELFVRALGTYLRALGEIQRQVLCSPGRTGAERLHDLLEVVLGEEAEAARDGHAAGCISVATLMSPDLRSRDARIGALLDDDRRRQHAWVAQAARDGQADGSVTSDDDPDDIAWAVSGLISGIRVNAQAGAPVAVLRRTVAIGLRALRP
ncbi:TetR/AcrR family transcriptional regulator [Kineosporia succinea]|uniref:AcrR family transcriptional regulator n=1 Tax=Kineosporia succinea TaxID=84632 RepID=A0ABT9PCW5_9ACTN|nr:TetR/AcrR family transcriptional regulator [Kineosporia succinea]MDP9830538.1 AcrR family transcriptional regulator [Kineosporia succinea]